MNSNINILVNSGNSFEYVNTAVNEAYFQFEYVVQKFSRFSKTSELSLLNNSKGKLFKCSDDFFKLIEFALDIAHLTNGVFDPTVIDILTAYGFTNKAKEKQLSKVELKHLVDSRPSYKEIILDKHKKTIKLKPNQGIDLGAIGKGYAIDLAYNVLIQKFESFLIDAGGDIRLHGKNDKGKPWKIDLEYIDKLNTKRLIGYLRLSEGSICSSGAFARKLGQFHHLINPKTGQPKSDLLSSFILSDNAFIADTFSTVSFLLGNDFQNLQSELQKKYNLQYLLIPNNEELIKSDNFNIIRN